MKLGVFDSGIGGEAIAASLALAFPDATLITVNDKAHIPYGSRPQHEVIQLTEHAIMPLLDGSCDIIVIACNTATTLALPTLRDRYPHQTFIGIGPMIKPAGKLTKSGVITVCATPSTLNSARYQQLLKTYADHATILEPDCSNWAYMIESSQINEQQIYRQLTECMINAVTL